MLSGTTADAPTPVASDLGGTFAPARETRSVVVERVARTRGTMTPLYSTDAREAFRVRSGELTFFVGDDVISAAAGDTVVAPAGVARAVRVESAEARWLSSTEVVSPARYDDFGRALSLPTGEWTTDEDAATVTGIAAVNRIAVLGPPGRLP